MGVDRTSRPYVTSLFSSSEFLSAVVSGCVVVVMGWIVLPRRQTKYQPRTSQAQSLTGPSSSSGPPTPPTLSVREKRAHTDKNAIISAAHGVDHCQEKEHQMSHRIHHGPRLVKTRASTIVTQETVMNAPQMYRT